MKKIRGINNKPTVEIKQIIKNNPKEGRKKDIWNRKQNTTSNVTDLNIPIKRQTLIDYLKMQNPICSL